VTYFQIDIYHKKKRECADLAAEINLLKKDIDEVGIHVAFV
jgi:hypothetical protein